MRNRIQVSLRLHCWFTLLVALLIVSSSSLNAAAAAAPARPLPPAQANELAEATRLNAEVARLYNLGKYDEAIPLARRALAIREKAFNPPNLLVAQSCNNLAELYRAKGEYAMAEPLYQRALTILETLSGPYKQLLARSLNALGELYRLTGEYAKAEPLHQRALAIYQKLFPPDHQTVAFGLSHLALLYFSGGDYVQAEPLFKRALAILEQARPQDLPSVAAALNNFAALYFWQVDFAQAKPLLQRALLVLEKADSPNPLEIAQALNNLAGLYVAQRDYAQAEPLFKRALAIVERALPPNHPDVASYLSNFAVFYFEKGEHAKAEPLLQRAMTIREKALSPNHPDVAAACNNLATYYQAQGDLMQAVALRRRAADISERNIALHLVTGSERQRLVYLETFAYETDLTISLHTRSAPDEPGARRLALTTVLRRKGRVLDATADSFAALRRGLNPQDVALLDQLTSVCSQLATLVLGGPGQTDLAQYRAAIKQLEDQAERLETEISARRSEFRTLSQPVALESIQAAIPPGAALIEYVSYFPFEVKTSKVGARRYVAYVLGHQGEPAWVDLGEAAEIDTLVDQLRAVLRKERNKPLSDAEREVKPRARALDRKIMQPVRKLLGDQRALLISPDGALNLIPFAALVDEQSKYLIESYLLTYLTTGRDLLRLQARSENKQVATVFADPDFGTYPRNREGRILESGAAKKETHDSNTATPGKAPKAFDFSQAYFSALPGTAQEARALKTLFPQALIWTQLQATKSRLKQVNAPALLHIATHGFFLNDLVVSAARARTRDLVMISNQSGVVASAKFHVADPLLRSGLAVAGANLHRDDDNGILTAKEVSGLNLRGTKLVVLSACDTGVGEVKSGDGVYGLRRALVLAGAESQVMSLWPVSDAGTRDLMVGYYKGLQAGGGRSEALRQVQLRMLKRGDRKHPYYWASFIQSGEWANLAGKR